MNVLVVNAGSSSLKYQLFDTTANEVKGKGICERIGIEGSRIEHKKDGNKTITKSVADRLSAIREHYHKVIIESCGNCKIAFNHLVNLCEEKEKYVWDLLEDDIYKIVG